MVKMKSFLVILLIILLFTLVSCQDQQNDSVEENGNHDYENSEQEDIIEFEEDEDPIEDHESDKEGEENASQEDTKEEVVNPEEVNANELGDVMVLMYHHISEPEDTWVRTPDNFRQDLQNLYDLDFRPVSIEDYAKGKINLEAGMKPVVLTFDDGRQNNFNMIEDQTGEWIIDPDSAVGILVDFHEENPDFPLEATFFINGGTPFGQEEFVRDKLEFIVANGMDIGNHSYTHANFTDLDAEELQRELGRLTKMVREYLPDYDVNTLALPFGSRPGKEELQTYLHRGGYDDIIYEHIAILEVGWQPYFSPYHINFDPLKIQRVRASEMNVDNVGMYDWINHFETGNRRPFISDGSKNTISFPKEHYEYFNESMETDRKANPF